MLGTASESIDLKMNLADDFPTVLIDHVQIQQVIHNLLRNSIDALSDSDGSTVFVTTLARGDVVEVSVGDRLASGSRERTRRAAPRGGGLSCLNRCPRKRR